MYKDFLASEKYIDLISPNKSREIKLNMADRDSCSVSKYCWDCTKYKLFNNEVLDVYVFIFVWQ